MTKRLLLAVLLVIPSSTVLAESAPAQFSVPTTVNTILADNCIDCHGPQTSEGDIRFDNLAGLKLSARLDLLNKAREQIVLGLMPPKDAKQVKAKKQAQLVDWMAKELHRHNASTLEDKLRKPEYGNYVDHDKLFSGEFAHLKPFTYNRRWLISEYIFDARFNRILNHKPFQTIDGKRQYVIGQNNRRVNLTNPFLLPTNTGVRYYANTTLNGGHLLTMITNAKEVSAYIVGFLAKRDKKYLPAINAVMAMEDEHNRILSARQTFLHNFIDRILQDIYQDKHTELLPKFTPVKRTVTQTATGKQTKKAPFHAANPGAAELALIFRTMRKHEKKGETDAELIAKCEQDWFNFGHSKRKIHARVTFLRNYMTEWRQMIVKHRYNRKHKPLIYRPLQASEMQAIRETILRHRARGDHYNTVIDKCMTQWKTEFQQTRERVGPPNSQMIRQLVDQLFEKLLERPPTSEERNQYVVLTQSYITNLGNQKAIEKLIQTLLLRSEFVYRQEFGQGKADSFGRKMLSPRDACYAIAFALTDSSPDQQLMAAMQNGKLETREDYRREVLRLLKKRDQYYIIDEGVQRLQLTASITNIPIRKLRFFREFFGYPRMLPIFKDNKRFGANYDKAKGRLVGEADRLVEHILKEDKQVFKQLLTTENFYVFHSGDNAAMKASSDRIRTIYDYFRKTDWQNFTVDDLAKHEKFLRTVKMRGVNVDNLSARGRRNPIREFKTAMTSFKARFDKGQTAAAPFVSFPAHGPYNASTRTGLQLRSPEVARFFNIQLDRWNYPPVQPAPVAHRKGMLTHPAWLIAHAQNTETDPVKRGKWIREKLLAGTVPAVPITVDAVIPEDHHQTLRNRLAGATEKQECWKCHQRMNPLGYPFEIYDDFGRYRTRESLEHPDNLIKKSPDKGGVYIDLRDVYKSLPVNPKGYLDGTGEKQLDGEVNDAFELIERLAKSKRVRQSMIRYAFRYFLGRNERLTDSKTLIEADRAYVESGGSFDALIVSLLTSDSFIYRKNRGQ